MLAAKPSVCAVQGPGKSESGKRGRVYIRKRDGNLSMAYRAPVGLGTSPDVCLTRMRDPIPPLRRVTTRSGIIEGGWSLLHLPQGSVSQGSSVCGRNPVRSCPFGRCTVVAKHPRLKFQPLVSGSGTPPMSDMDLLCVREAQEEIGGEHTRAHLEVRTTPSTLKGLSNLSKETDLGYINE